MATLAAPFPSDLGVEAGEAPQEATLYFGQATPAVVAAFFERELGTPELDQMHDHLWAVAKRSGDHIDALHVQIIKRRQVVIAEDPRLHLVWDNERIFVKPVPECLFVHDVWSKHLAGRDDFARRAALGFLRSYAYLIQHRSDYLIAREKNLFPQEYEWDYISEFLGHFRGIDDSDVHRRYIFGQMRLSRLNWATRLLRPAARKSRWFYEPPFWSTASYLAMATVPLLFIFATLSLSLSAMQVMLALPAKDLGFPGDEALAAYAKTFWGFSIAVIAGNGLSWLLMLLVPLTVWSIQLLWGFRHRRG